MDATSLAHKTSAPTRAPRVSGARLTLGLMLAFPLAFGIAFGGAGFFAVFPPVVVGSLVAAVAGVAVLLLDRRWMVIVGLVVAVLTFGLGASDPTPGSMTRPSLGLQMSWGHAARFAGLVGLVAAIAELRGAMRAGRLARASSLAAMLFVGLALGIGATTQAALVDPGLQQGGTLVALEPDATVTIVEKGNSFVVDGNAAAGGLVRLVVENRDANLHSFTTREGPAVDAENLGSSATEILARAPAAPGEWRFFCKYHPGMEGTILVAPPS